MSGPDAIEASAELESAYMQNGIQRNCGHTYGRNFSAGNDTICMYAELGSERRIKLKS